MSTPTTPQAVIARQVRRVRRRLWIKNLLHGLLLGWSGAFLLATLYFVVRSAIWGPGPEWIRWLVLGSSAGLGMVFALVRAIVCAPSNVTSSLALDERFALKERVTTSLCLSAREKETSAGQAVLEDAHGKVAAIDVAERFPIGPRWRHVILPLGLAALALLALFFSPQLDFLSFSRAGDNNKSKVDDKAVKKQMDELKKTLAQMDKKEGSESKEMKKLEAEIKKLLTKELDPKNEKQVRETIQDMKKLEDQMKKRLQDQKELAMKSKDLRETLKNIEKLGKKMKDGPGKDFQEALKNGDLKKAADELERLRKKLEKKELTKEDEQNLKDQMQDLKDRLERLLDERQKELQKEFQDRLKDLEDPNLKDELQKEYEDRLQKEQADEDDLAELEQLLEDCKNCKGGGELSGKLLRLRMKLLDLDLDEDELRELLANCDDLEGIRLALLGACRGDCCGGMGTKGGGPPGGRRPVGKEPQNSKISNERQRGDVDPNGRMRVIGFSKGGIFKQVPAAEIEGVFKQADQESAETLDRQHIPSDAADVAKGYFKQLGGQK